MTRAADKAYRLRWLILVIGLLCVAAGVWYAIGCPPWGSAGTLVTPIGPLDPLGRTSTPAMVAYFVIFFGLFLLTQWLFLLPRKHWPLKLTQRGRPMAISLIVAALMAMLLTTGFIATLLQVAHGWEAVAEEQPQWKVPLFGFVWIGMGMLWIIWAAIFLAYWRAGDDYTCQTKMIRALLSGSIIEMLVAAPVQTFATDPKDCYCTRGSYTGLVLGGTVLCWCFGPGIVLLFLREKYRRAELLHPHCLKCGYDLHGTTLAGRIECPECGAAIPPRLSETPA